MIWTKQEISQQNVVVGAVAAGQRSSTYDPTVGKILTQKGRDQGASYNLPPRGIAWVISSETIVVPNNVTGLATLRTTWTKNGVLTLTLGIIDPGFVGPVSTAVVNFGKSNFKIKKGDPFFRMMFIEHAACPEVPPLASPVDARAVHAEYLAEVQEQTKNFSNTFLTIDTLGPEILKSVLKLPSWGIWLGLIATFLAVVAITTGIGIALWVGTFDLKNSLNESNKLRDTSTIELQAKFDQLATELKALAEANKPVEATAPPKPK